jgi:hypothetical protein
VERSGRTKVALQGRLDATGVAPGRTALNLFYLTDAGREELVQALRSGCYRVELPEEGALPTVAWLLAHGAADDAHRLLEAIAPFFDRLRFFPAPNERPMVAGTAVRLQPIGKTVARSCSSTSSTKCGSKSCPGSQR